jgi:two-component SAPR family response regulator
MKTSNDTALKNIMILDDDPFSMLLTRMKLKKVTDEKNIFEFYDINEGLKYLVAHNPEETAVIPDLILIEVLMNNSMGWDFIEQYQKMLINGEISKSQLVILTSSQFFSDYRRASGFDCVSGFMMKPLQTSTLLDIFRNVIEGKVLLNNTFSSSFVV